MKSFPTDLSDKEWQVIQKIQKDTRKRDYDLREIWDAIFYIDKTGCQWRMLPHNFAPWTVVYYYFRNWKLSGLIHQIHAVCRPDELRNQVREKAGKSTEPNIGIIDSQTVDSSLMPCSTKVYEDRGFDANKKLKGRKRHIVVDSLGLILVVLIHSANILDRNGAVEVLRKLNEKYSSIKKVFADAGYNGKLLNWVEMLYKWVLEIVNKKEGQVGFEVLPKRWIVERTFAWWEGTRRLAKDYEITTSSTEAFIHISMIRIMLKRL